MHISINISSSVSSVHRLSQKMLLSEAFKRTQRTFLSSKLPDPHRSICEASLIHGNSVENIPIHSLEVLSFSFHCSELLWLAVCQIVFRMGNTLPPARLLIKVASTINSIAGFLYAVCYKMDLCFDLKKKLNSENIFKVKTKLYKISTFFQILE